jgi:hypothetical protein
LVAKLWRSLRSRRSEKEEFHVYGGKGQNPPDCRDPPVEDETKISFAWKFAKEVLNENILAQKAG